jgi:chorismate dehydratase
LLSLPGILAQENASLDVIYQDPFSPKKNPELWTTDWFEKLKKLSRPGTVLCTYSASSAVRKALGAAGWTVQSFAGFARKKQSTKAFL